MQLVAILTVEKSIVICNTNAIRTNHSNVELINFAIQLLVRLQYVSLLILFVAPFALSTAATAATTPAEIIYTPSKGLGAVFNNLAAACDVQVLGICKGALYMHECGLLSIVYPVGQGSPLCYYKYFNTAVTPPGNYVSVVSTDWNAVCPANTTHIGTGYETLCDDGCAAPAVKVVVNGIASCAIAPFPPKNEPDPPKTCPPTTTNNPISFNAGNKFLHELDYVGVSGGIDTLFFTRTYNSTSIVRVDNQGERWRSPWSRNINSINNFTFAYRNGGKTFTFNNAGSSWNTDADITDKLVEVKDTSGVRTGWTYTIRATGEVESYDALGKLLSITNLRGQIQTLTYSCNEVSAVCPVATPSTTTSLAGLLIQVSDSLGRHISFTYDSQFRINTMTNPAGGLYTYAYDSNNNLSTVTYPDGKTKTYLYGEPSNVSASPNTGVSYTSSLTGIIDENNNRYASYFYDAAGRANAEYLAGNTDAANLTYNTDASGNPTTTVVTDSRGSARTYNFTTILGVVKSTGQSQPGGSGCAASAAALTYDVNGNVASRTDFKGNKTTYAYDMARNLETSRTEGLTSAGAATAATRTITSTWHPTWRLPLVVTEYTGGTANLSNGSGTPTGTALRSTTTVYDAKGNITSITEADPVRSTSRTTSISYTYSSAVPGLVLTKVIDGPRTDVSDISTYHYYPHDATCTPSTATPIIDPITNTSPANLGCRGQLQSVTNALNQPTSYDRYNHHGQVEQMTDANGLVTTSTYDLRQRLLTRTVGTERTSLVYDGVGQVTQLTLPDASQLNYSYDAAHRLTDVQDSLGNKVHYTLDSEGNRTNETTTDPANVLTKTLSRSYDALNRLQQVTGVE